MVPVKKLSLILQDALGLLASMEQRHSGVLVEFTCYRNGVAVHESGPLRRPQFRLSLPEACRNAQATEVALRYFAVGMQGDSRQVNQSRFLLAAKEPSPPSYPAPATPGYGLGGFQPSYHPGMDGWSGGGGGGLGAVQETAALVNQIVSDELFRKEHRDLQREAEGLRSKVVALEAELDEQQVAINASKKFDAVLAQITPFLPLLQQLVGPGSKAEKALSGLMGIGEEKSDEAATDDAQTAVVVATARGFMKTLPPAYKVNMAQLMQCVQKTPALIPQLTRFAQAQTQTAGQPAGTAPAPDKTQQQQQPQTQPDGAQPSNSQGSDV